MNDLERKSIELRKQKGSLEAKIEELEAHVLGLDADIAVIERYTIEVPSRVLVKDTNMKVTGVNLQGQGMGARRFIYGENAVRSHGSSTIWKKRKKDGDGDDSGLSDLGEMSEESELTELERDPRLPPPIYPKLSVKRPAGRLNDGPATEKRRKRSRDGEEEEDEGFSESAKKRCTKRYALRDRK